MSQQKSKDKVSLNSVVVTQAESSKSILQDYISTQMKKSTEEQRKNLIEKEKWHKKIVF